MKLSSSKMIFIMQKKMSADSKTVILRFRDLVTAEGETIQKHIAVIEKHNYVWWGWWKKGNEKTPISEFAALKIAATTHPIDIYLVDSGQSLVYHAICTDIHLKEEEKSPSPEKDKTPEYYQDQKYCVWFKLTKIEPCDPAHLSGFSYVDCKELFCDSNVDYSRFDNKKIYSVSVLQKKLCKSRQAIVKETGADQGLARTGHSPA